MIKSHQLETLEAIGHGRIRIRMGLGELRRVLLLLIEKGNDVGNRFRRLGLRLRRRCEARNDGEGKEPAG